MSGDSYDIRILLVVIWMFLPYVLLAGALIIGTVYVFKASRSKSSASKVTKRSGRSVRLSDSILRTVLRGLSFVLLVGGWALLLHFVVVGGPNEEGMGLYIFDVEGSPYKDIQIGFIAVAAGIVLNYLSRMVSVGPLIKGYKTIRRQGSRLWRKYKWVIIVASSIALVVCGSIIGNFALQQRGGHAFNIVADDILLVQARAGLANSRQYRHCDQMPGNTAESPYMCHIALRGQWPLERDSDIEWILGKITRSIDDSVFMAQGDFMPQAHPNIASLPNVPTPMMKYTHRKTGMPCVLTQSRVNVSSSPLLTVEFSCSKDSTSSLPGDY